MTVKSLHSKGRADLNTRGLLYLIDLPGEMQRVWEGKQTWNSRFLWKTVKNQIFYRYTSAPKIRSFDQNASPELNWSQGGFFWLDKVWERSCLPSGHQQAPLCRDCHPGPGLRAWQAGREQEVCEEQGQTHSETGPDFSPVSRMLLWHKKDFCRQAHIGKDLLLFPISGQTNGTAVCYVYIQENIPVYGITFFSKRKQNECLTPETSWQRGRINHESSAFVDSADISESTLRKMSVRELRTVEAINNFHCNPFQRGKAENSPK